VKKKKVANQTNKVKKFVVMIAIVYKTEKKSKQYL